MMVRRLSRRRFAQFAALLGLLAGPARARTAQATVGTATPSMYGVDSQHTGQLRMTGPRTLGLAWQQEVWSRVEAGVAVGPDGTVYVPGDTGRIFAFTPQGDRKWSYWAPDWVRAAPAVDGAGHLLLSLSIGQLLALNPDGTVAWTFQTEGGVVAPVTFGHNGAILFGSDAGQRYYLYPDGRGRYSKSSDGAIRSAPAVAPDGTIYWLSDKGALHITGPDGVDREPIPILGEQPWWRLSPSASPAVDDTGYVYVGAADGTLVCLAPWWFNLQTLEPKTAERWRVRLGLKPLATPAIAPSGTLLVGSEDGKLRAVNPADGSVLWQYATGGTLTAPPLIGGDGSIYIASGDSHLYVLSAQGQMVSAFKTGEGIPGPPALAPGGSQLYVGSRDRRVYAVREMDPGPRAPPLADGLVRDFRNGRIYLVIEGRRHHVPDPATFELLGLDWRRVGAPPAAELDSAPLAPALPHLEEGATVRTPDGKVYLIRPGRWEWVLTPDAFAAAGLRWEDVLPVPQGVLRFAPVSAGTSRH